MIFKNNVVIYFFEKPVKGSAENDKVPAHLLVSSNDLPKSFKKWKRKILKDFYVGKIKSMPDLVFYAIDLITVSNQSHVNDVITELKLGSQQEDIFNNY